jgi:hypothetical protein
VVAAHAGTLASVTSAWLVNWTAPDGDHGARRAGDDLRADGRRQRERAKRAGELGYDVERLTRRLVGVL